MGCGDGDDDGDGDGNGDGDGDGDGAYCRPAGLVPIYRHACGVMMKRHLLIIFVVYKSSSVLTRSAHFED